MNVAIIFPVIPLFEYICQRCGRFQKGFRLPGRQVVVFQRQQNILPAGVFIGMVQNLLRGLRHKPVLEMRLLGKHLLV